MIIKMILTNDFSPDVRVYKEAEHLISCGNDVEILCWDKTPLKDLPTREVLNGIHVIRFKIPSVAGSGYRQLGAFKTFISACKQYLKNEDYDMLHCHDLDGAVTGWRIGGRFVFDMHEFYDRGNPVRKRISHYMTKYLAKKAEACVYVAPVSIETYGKGIEEKFFLLKNYNDSTYFSDIKKNKSDKIRISYIGMVRNQIAEFSALFEAVKGLNFVDVNIYGGGIDLKKLLQLSEDYENVTVHGPYDGIKESVTIYKDTDICFIAYDPSNPNYQNDFEPVKLYEAIFTRTPIIATESLNPGKMAMKERIGLAVDTRDSGQIRKAILQFFDNRDYYQNCRQNMGNIADRYDWKEAVKVLDQIYGTN